MRCFCKSLEVLSECGAGIHKELEFLMDLLQNENYQSSLAQEQRGSVQGRHREMLQDIEINLTLI